MKTKTLNLELLRKIDAYWHAANYLSVGQIYLLDNPLLREPLTLEHVKPRLLGHWGTTPGLNFIYAHLNRLIRAREAELGRAPTPIIALTANAMTHQVESYRASGMDGVISKPIDVAELFAAIIGMAEADDAPPGAAVSL